MRNHTPGDKKTQHSAKKKKSPASAAGRRKKKSTKVLRILFVLLFTLAVLLALALLALSLWKEPPTVASEGPKLQEKPAQAESVPVTPSPSAVIDTEEDPFKPTPAPTPEVQNRNGTVRREGTYLLLVVGRDRVGLNTDTIMVVMMDTKARCINVVSIPRDTLVNVPWAVKKVNSIYANYGLEGLVDGVEDLIGLPIDSYVVVNTQVFQQAVDTIGGVWFEVPINMYYDDPGQDLHIHLNAGYQLLNGYQAEGVVRFRQNNDGSGYFMGDLDRIETQHAFLRELAEQLLSLGNISNLPALVDLVIKNTDTNLTSGNIAFYAREFFKMSSGAVRFYTMPNETVNIYGGSYVNIQLNPWLEMINDYLNPFNVDVTAENLDVLTYYNGTYYSTTGRIAG
ncbi:MAG: LCP family protein [Oscillospiraceae bacterium]|nr:LCP family protein [Oscillospiraceae bacterium]